MSLTHGSKRPHLHDASALPPSVVNQQPPEVHTKHIPPSSRELQRLIERRRAQELDIELPMTTAEAADYVGLLWYEVEELADAGAIPAHRVSSTPGKWVFYASELDMWLRDAGQAGGADASSQL